MAAGITFEQAKHELRVLGRRYEADLIGVDEWCHSVHDVIVRFEAGRDEAPVNATPLAAPAPPRVADRPETVASQFRNVVASAHRGERHLMTGQGA